MVIFDMYWPYYGGDSDFGLLTCLDLFRHVGPSGDSGFGLLTCPDMLALFYGGDSGAPNLI